jgi:hypothetical protein
MKKTKMTIATIALILTLTFGSIITFLPAINAAVVTTTSHMYLTVSPNPVGVGQSVLVVWWTAEMPRPETIEEIAAGVRGGWYDVSTTVTKPDGTTQTIAMPKSDPVGGGYIAYLPDTVGTYYFQAHLPGQWRNTTITQTYYTAADSNIAELTVQQEPIEPWPETPLPTEYWTRPINAMNREWWQLTGSMLGGTWRDIFGGVWPPGAAGGTTDRFCYGQAPESAHIMWTKPYWAGGIMDYQHGSTGFQTHHYQGLAISPIILYGKIYYSYRVNAHETQGYLCVDLYTGETIYYKNETMPSYATIYDYESPNQHGGFPYLWVTSGVTLPEGYTSQPGTQTWQMLDGFTGEPITIIANVSSGGTAVYGKDGSVLRYNTVNLGTSENPNYYLTCWNSSATPSLLAGTSGTSAWQWRPIADGARRQSVRTTDFNEMYVHDGSQGFSLNVSIPDVSGRIYAVREGEFIIGGSAGSNNEDGIVPGNLWALSLKPEQEGTLLWNRTFTPPSSAGGVSISGPAVDPEDGVFLFQSTRELKRWGYSLETGQLLWGPTEPEPALNYYGMQYKIYQGMLLTYGYGGVLIAYNITTGEILWKYTATGVGFESPYGNYPMGIGCIADGKIYIGTGEHSPTQPLYRGPVLRCINASNGVELWSFPVYGVSMYAGNAGDNFAIADGFLVALNAYDNQIYCFGKGSSATTVTASPSVVNDGSSVIIQGRVTDESPGTKQDEQAARFPNGVPAISDESMGPWMEYLYQQRPIPADATGVPVTLDAIDPNGNFISIGRVTSDMSGFYSYKWKPENEGKYTIIATFEGSDSYYASYAETAIGVDPAPSPAGPIEPEPTEAPLITTELAIIAAVAVAVVIGIVAYWALRKRK